MNDFKVGFFPASLLNLANRIKDLGGTILDLFLLELVKPYHFLAYENRLALAIKRHGDPYLKDAVIEVGNSPDYNSNRDLFGCECGIPCA